MTQALTVPVKLSASSIDAYIASVSSAPVLSAEQEQQLARRLRDDNDLEAARLLVLSHMRYVVHIARSYSGYGLALPDLIQEGSIGLMKAVKRFDPQHGVRLVSYAVHWIKSEIHEYVIKNWRIVKVATTKAQRKLFFNLRKQKNNLSWLNDAEATAIANDLGVKKSDVYEMEQRLGNNDATFDGHQDDAPSEDATYLPVQYIEQPEANPATQFETANEIDAQQEKLRLALMQLDERSQAVLTARWLNEPKATLHELADEFDVSAERIRQIEKNAMNKIKAAFI